MEESWSALAAWFEQVEASAWSAVAAWLALGIGLLNLWYSVIRVWWLGRKASPSARLDLLSYQTQIEGLGRGRAGCRHQPRASHHEASHRGRPRRGRELPGWLPVRPLFWPTMPVEYLHVGQSLYLKLERSAADRRPSVADLRWGDNRWRKQLRSVDLTYNRVL